MKRFRKFKLKPTLRRWEKPTSILLGALVLSAALLNFDFNLLEAKLYDFRIEHNSTPAVDSDIVLITLDETTTRELNDFAPLSLDFHTKVLEQLQHYRPRALGYFINMSQVNQVNPDLFNSGMGARFVKAAQNLELAGTPVLMGTPFDVNGEILPPYPLSALQHSVAIIHQDGNVFAGDRVTRRALTILYNKPTFHLTLAQLIGSVKADYRPKGSFSVPQINGEYFFFRFHGDLTDDPAQSPYPRYSLSQVLSGALPDHALTGKIILVGTLNPENPGDFAVAPFSRSPLGYPKLYIHANILDSIIHNHSVIIPPSTLNAAFTFALSAFVFWAVLSLSPLVAVLSTGAATLAFFGLGVFLFNGTIKNTIWITLSQPLVAVFLSFYLMVPYRLIREYRKRWNYQKQNEVLVQVELLKTNFLSLVTHDLKTPVARIQGLAEVLIKKLQALPPEERKSLHQIVDSTEELNRFISSILELSKVESTQLKLQIESKDINQLIERAVQNFSAQARTKNIEILLELEPLFPVKIDPSLISKVINNLIDNALKYSPDHSTIKISSAEIEDVVEVKITDQGEGLTEEQVQNLFTKFYRAKHSSESKVGGSGLGLYLSRFFIEAHQGTLEVESSPGAGSTFTIRLPLIAQNPGLTQNELNTNRLNQFSTKKENPHV